MKLVLEKPKYGRLERKRLSLVREAHNEIDEQLRKGKLAESLVSFNPIVGGVLKSRTLFVYLPDWEAPEPPWTPRNAFECGWMPILQNQDPNSLWPDNLGPIVQSGVFAFALSNHKIKPNLKRLHANVELVKRFINDPEMKFDRMVLFSEQEFRWTAGEGLLPGANLAGSCVNSYIFGNEKKPIYTILNAKKCAACVEDPKRNGDVHSYVKNQTHLYVEWLLKQRQQSAGS